MADRPKVGKPRLIRWWAAAAGLAVLALAACGGSSSPTTVVEGPATTAPITTVFVPEAQVAPRTSPPPKPTTTTTTMPLPTGFPADLAVPAGNVGYYTGSGELGFHLNVSTDQTYSELVAFFTDAIAANPDWEIGVRNVGLGFVPGFEDVWAIYTSADHVLTQLTGPFAGVIEVEGRHVNILLDPLEQPELGVEPEVLPPLDEVPRPQTEMKLASFSSGLVKLAYETGPAVFDDLITEYRLLRWSERAVNGFGEPGSGIAVGDLFGWRITVEDIPDAGAIFLEFENLELSYP